MHDVIRVVLVDDEAAQECERLFGAPCARETELHTLSGKRLLLRSETDPDALLLQLTAGHGQAFDVALLDMDFSRLKRGRLELADPSPRAYPPALWGFSILKTIKRIDPDLPVVMLTVQSSANVCFEAGQEEADGYFLKEDLCSGPPTDRNRQNQRDQLWNQLHQARMVCRRRAIYDHEHKDTANRFAHEYDTAEREKLATVAYYHFENDLIDNQVRQLVSHLPEGRRLRILDVGCGTGRVEEHLCRRNDCGRLSVVAVDFAEDMIDMASQKLRADPRIRLGVGRDLPDDPGDQLHVSLFRAPAERLGFLGQRYRDGFDLAVLGFGFLSYVNYTDVLPACPQKPPATGILPLLKDGGALVFSVYNEHSAIYERIARLDYPDDELPIAALMDLSEGRLKVGSYYFACEAFTLTRMVRFLRQAGFSVVPEEVTTFPTAHLMLRSSEAARVPVDTEFPPGRFDPNLYSLDRDLCAVVRERGHYVVGVARKAADRFEGFHYQEG